MHRWYFSLKTVDVLNRVVHKPDGPLCFPCGLTADAWPKLTHLTVTSKFSADRSVRGEFEMLKSRLQAAIDRALDQECAFRENNHAVQVYSKPFFVFEEHFTAKWQPPASLGIQVVDLHVPVHEEEQQGVLFQPSRKWPEDVPYFRVRLTSSKALHWQKYVLHVEDIVRKKQGKEHRSH